jgi:ribonuclease HII
MKLVCGVDEAGRGPLAGPVYAAAVILGPGKSIKGITDSKALPPERREELAREIRAHAVAWAVASASVEEIDTINILQASLLAMRRAVEALQVVPERVLVDGLHCPPLGMPSRAVVRGDGTVVAIGAASILAKVARDEEMRALHVLHPQYGFDQHKGYPTPDHLVALRTHGASIVHRRTFGPVRLVLGLRSTPE